MKYIKFFDQLFVETVFDYRTKSDSRFYLNIYPSVTIKNSIKFEKNLSFTYNFLFEEFTSP